MRKVVWCGVVLGVLLANLNVWAQEQPSESEFKPKIFMFSLGTGMSPLEEPMGIVPGSINTRLGLFATPKIVIDFGLDFTRAHLSLEDKEDEHKFFDEAVNIFTLHLGSKFYFLEPNRAGKITFYDQASFFLLIPFAASDSEGFEDAVSDSFTFGFLEGIGAEYFFADNFSVGGEFGLNLYILTHDGTDVKGAGDVIDLYTGFTLNFFI